MADKPLATFPAGTPLKGVDSYINSILEGDTRRGTPRLFDMLMQSNAIHRQKDLWLYKKSPYFVNTLRNAHRFVLTDEAALGVANAIISFPEMLVDNGQFAIPPFEKMWLEFPSQNYNYQFIHKGLDDPTADVLVGFLIDGNRVYVASASKNEEEPAFLPFHYELNRGMTLEEEQKATEFFGVSRAQLDDFFWGHTFSQEADLTQIYKRSLRLMHSLVLDFDLKELKEKSPEFHGRMKEVGEQIFIGAAGELRNIVGMLLAINQPAKFKYVRDVGHKRKLTSKGTKVFMSHTMVEFRLDKRSGVKRLLKKNPETVAQRMMRWHPVKGHFCHDAAGRQETGCSHGGGNWWVEVSDRKWECLNCGGKRWWREYPDGHGSAQVGFVNSHHFVRGKAA